MLILAIALLLTADWHIRLANSLYVVSSKHVLIKIGLVRRHTLELLRAKVESIGVEQGVLGHIFNYGTIVVTGTGGTKEFFSIDCQTASSFARPFKISAERVAP